MGLDAESWGSAMVGDEISCALWRIAGRIVMFEQESRNIPLYQCSFDDDDDDDDDGV